MGLILAMLTKKRKGQDEWKTVDQTGIYHLHVQIAEHEMRCLKALVKRSGLGQSVYVRRLIFAQAIASGLYDSGLDESPEPKKLSARARRKHRTPCTNGFVSCVTHPDNAA